MVENMLGIYMGDINIAYSDAINLLNRTPLEIDNIDDLFKKNIKENFDWEDPTNSIIRAMFEVTENLIRDNYGLEVIYNLNGDYAGIDIDDSLYRGLYYFGEHRPEKELIWKILQSDIRDYLDEDDIIEIACDSPETMKDLLEVKDGEFTYFDSVEELGAVDNDLKEEDDTDESFGEFLINAYKDGNSRDVIYELSNGKVICGCRL